MTPWTTFSRHALESCALTALLTGLALCQHLPWTMRTMQTTSLARAWTARRLQHSRSRRSNA